MESDRNQTAGSGARVPRLRKTAAVAAGVTLLLHLVANPHYGFFRDELYFIVCGQHPAFGYVDQPPAAPLAAALSQIFGPSLFLLRAVAALAAAVAVYASCLLAIEFGGGTFAIVLTAICVTLAPVLSAFGTMVGTDTFMLWTWPLAVLFIVRALRGGATRDWLLAGATIGIAAESKYSVAFFMAAVLVGLASTPQRRAFTTRGFWLGTALAVAIALPNVLWQARMASPWSSCCATGRTARTWCSHPPSSSCTSSF